VSTIRGVRSIRDEGTEMNIATVAVGAGADLADLATAVRDAARQTGLAAVLVEVAGEALDPRGDQVAAGGAAARLRAALRRAAAPTVLAVTGPVGGAGLAALLHFDVVLSAPTSTFTAGDPDSGALLASDLAGLLTRRVGAGRARQLVLTGRFLGAATALDWGLVAGVDPQCADRAGELARSWADSPGAGLALRALDAAQRLPAADAAGYARDLLPLLAPAPAEDTRSDR